MTYDLTIVNIVGSGRVDTEIDLAALADDLSFGTVYIKGPGLYFKFHDDEPTVIVARSGKYIISGAKSTGKLEDTRTKVLDLFVNMGVIDDRDDLSFSVKNILFTYDIDDDVNLSSLAIYAGLENTEYEPEQFPGLIYRPPSINSVALVFTTGKTVITGVTSRSAAEETIEAVLGLIEGIKKDV